MCEHGGIQGFELPADCNPVIRKAVAYWRSIKPASGLPGRQHLDPMDIPHLLPNVWLIDVRRDPLRFAFRLVGTSVVEFFGSDPTGLTLDEAFEEFEETVAYQDFCLVAGEGKLRWRRGAPVLLHLEKFSRIERVYLPLARNGRDVDMIFCVSVFGVRGRDDSLSFAPLD